MSMIRSGFRFRTFSFGVLSAVFLHAQALAQPSSPDEASAEAAANQVEEIVVTGSYIPGTPEDAPSPVAVTTRADLDAIGNPNIVELLRNLGPSSGTDGETNQFQSNGLEGSSNINLRGLGAGRTLVLLNGSRMTKNPYYVGESGQQYVNTNTIPTIAIERIEVLLDGASATYGSDAIAGVANFITRSDFRGLEASLGYKNIAGSDGDLELGAIYGFEVGGLGVVASFGYSHRDELSTRERDWALRDFSVNPLGTSGIPNPSVYYPVSPVSGLPPFGFYYPNATEEGRGAATAIPEPDCAVVGGVATAGGGCRFRYTEFDNIAEEEEHWQIFAEAGYETAGGWGLDARLLIAFDEVPEWKSSPSYPPQSLFGPDRFAGIGMPHYDDFVARNPGLLPDDAVGVFILGRSFGVSGPPQVGRRKYLTSLLDLGLNGEIGSLGLDANLTYGLSDGERASQDLRIDHYAWAFRGLGGPNCDRANGTPGVGNCWYYNPFTSAYAESQAVGATGTPPGSENAALHNNAGLRDWLLEDVGTEVTTSALTLDVVVSGSFGQLGGGPIGWAAGGQFRRDTYEVTPNAVTALETAPCPFGLSLGETYSSADEVAAGRLADNPAALPFSFACPSAEAGGGNGSFHFLAGTTSADESQDVLALFFEAGLHPSESIDIQFALRVEDYTDVGTTVDPKIAVRWQAAPGFALRASAGSSFRAPGLNQLKGRVTTLQFINAAGATFKAVDTFGNPDLEPEEAVNVNLGLIFEPADNLLVTLDYWTFDFKKPIVVDPFGDIVARCGGQLDPDIATSDLGAAACARITFQDANNPSLAQLQRVQVNYENGADVKTSGLDFALNLDIPSGFGLFSTGVRGTYITEFEVDSSIWADAFSAVGRLNYSTSYARPLPETKANIYGAWEKGIHSVRLDLNAVSSYEDEDREDKPIDSFLTIDLHYNLRLLNDQLRVFASVYNLFDEDPPLAVRDLSYDPYTHSPFGRIIKVGVQYSLAN